MIRFNRFNRQAALCALLLCTSLNVSADDMQLAEKLFKQGQQSQALAKVESILSNHAKDMPARFLKGLILTEQGKTEEAIQIFTALTVDYPELPEPYNNLAVIYANQGQYEKAKTALEKALRTHPSYSTAHENLGDIYAQMASQAYDRALQLDRSNANSKTKLALIKDVYVVPAVKSGNTKIQVASNDTAKAATTAPAKPDTATLAATPDITLAPLPASATNKAQADAAKTIKIAVPDTKGSDAVLEAVQSWAKAWSSRNAGKYLTMYAKEFKTPNNESRSSWEKQRRERIDKPQPIFVTIINPSVKSKDDTHASVSFVQSYRSGKLKSTTRKTLEMIRVNNTWQILSEQTGK